MPLVYVAIIVHVLSVVMQQPFPCKAVRSYASNVFVTCMQQRPATTQTFSMKLFQETKWRDHTRLLKFIPTFSKMKPLAEPFKAPWLQYIPPGLTSKNSTFYSQILFTCFVWISGQTAIFSVYSIK